MTPSLFSLLRIPLLPFLYSLSSASDLFSLCLTVVCFRMLQVASQYFSLLGNARNAGPRRFLEIGELFYSFPWLIFVPLQANFRRSLLNHRAAVPFRHLCRLLTAERFHHCQGQLLKLSSPEQAHALALGLTVLMQWAVLRCPTFSGPVDWAIACIGVNVLGLDM